MENKLVSSGSVILRTKTYYYEMWSDNADVRVKIFHKGKKGDYTEFVRGRTESLKAEMDNALKRDKIFTKLNG